jgi:hypothetical protein
MSRQILTVLSVAALLLAPAAPRSEAKSPEPPRAGGEAVEQAMRGYAATLKSGPPEGFAALWHQDAGGAWHLARLMMQPVP